MPKHTAPGPDAPETPQKKKANIIGPAGQPMLLRCIAIGVVFVVAAALLVWRLGQLQIVEASEWEARAAGQQLASVEITPARGTIYDAGMKPLAQSATVWTIEASPDVMAQSKVAEDSAERDPARIAARELASILELDEATLYEKLGNKESKYYKVKAKVEKPMADAVREMCRTYGISGIYLTEDTKRYYPYEELAATALGFVGADNNGLEGLERWYEETLAGTPGRTIALQDAFGTEITVGDDATSYPAEDGNSIVLTLDTEIQRSVEKHLKAAVAEYNPKQRAMAVVMDVNTGAILALAVYPSYNPNQPYDILDASVLEQLGLITDETERSTLQGEARTLQWRNKTLADTYEPGSVMKVITAAAALDSGTYTENSTFYCGASIMVEGWDAPMGCAQGHDHGTPTLRTALMESCNVSFIRMSAGMGASVWYDYIKAFGLTEPTGINLPGEPSQASINNLIYSEDQMGPVQLASCSFGQSNKYTPIQMITAISAVVNGGNLMQPYIVAKELDASGNVVKNYEPQVKRQVITPETSAIICDTLEQMVATTSNGQNAYLAGYRVGGKSGTSEKLEVRTKEGRDAYISSFVGFAPADDPQIAVLVALDEPEDTKMGNFFGGRLAGPTVREIIRDSMQILGVEASYDSDEEKARDTVATPRLIDNELSYAQRLLNQADLTYTVVGGGNTVVGQCPSPGADAPYMAEVVIYTDNTAPEFVDLPDMSGKTPSAAMEQLKGLGLNVLTTGAPNSGSGVVVVRQNIEPGASVEKGTVVTLTMEDMTNIQDH